jgi:hypothetical protein
MGQEELGHEWHENARRHTKLFVEHTTRGFFVAIREFRG